jgi:hypothetical protein
LAKFFEDVLGTTFDSNSLLTLATLGNTTQIL